MPHSEPIGSDLDRIAKEVVDEAFRVHRELGPGLLESVYEVCLRQEIGKRGLMVRHQVPVPIVYDGVRLDAVCDWISWWKMH